MQPSLRPGSGTEGTIFVLRQFPEKYLFSKNKNLYFEFTDLEKVLVKKAQEYCMVGLRKLGTGKGLVKIVQSMYRNALSSVRFNQVVSDDFLVQVGLHKGSVLTVTSATKQLFLKICHLRHRLRICLICRKVTFHSQDIPVFAF